MQVRIDLAEEMMARLDELARVRRTDRVELIRQAVSEFLAKQRAFDAAFGLWAGRGEDGVAYQKRMRSEWGDRVTTSSFVFRAPR